MTGTADRWYDPSGLPWGDVIVITRAGRAQLSSPLTFQVLFVENDSRHANRREASTTSIPLFFVMVFDGNVSGRKTRSKEHGIGER